MKKKMAIFTVLAVILCVTIGASCNFANAENIVQNAVTTEELCRQYTNGQNENGINVTDYVNDYFLRYNNRVQTANKEPELFSSPAGNYFQNGCSYDAVYRGVLTLTLREDDNITKLIPRALFEEKTEKLYYGTEYGFFISTRIINGDITISTVILFSVDKTYQMDSVFTFRTSPLMQMEYVRITSHTDYIYLKKSSSDDFDSEFSNYYFENGADDVIVPIIGRTMVAGENSGIIDLKYTESERYKASDISFGSKIYNGNSLNVGDDNYGVADDYGYFVIGNEYEYSARKWNMISFQEGLTEIVTAASETALGCIDVVGDVLGVVEGLFKIGGAVHSMINGISYDSTNKKYEYPMLHYFTTREQQKAEYGNLVRSSVIAVNSSSREKIVFRRGDYAMGKYVLSHTTKPDGSKEYGLIDITVGMKIIDSKNNAKAHLSNPVAFELSSPQEHYAKEIGKFDYYVMPHLGMTFYVDAKYVSDCIIKPDNNNIDVYVDDVLQKIENGKTTCRFDAGKTYKIRLENTSDERIRGKMTLDCSDLLGAHTLEGGKSYIYKLAGGKNHCHVSTQNENIKINALYDEAFDLSENNVGLKDYVVRIQDNATYVVLKNIAQSSQTADVVDLGETAVTSGGTVSVPAYQNYAMYVYTSAGDGEYAFKFNTAGSNFSVQFKDAGFNSITTSKLTSSDCVGYSLKLSTGKPVYIIVRRFDTSADFSVDFSVNKEGGYSWIINGKKIDGESIEVKRGSTTKICLETKEGVRLPLQSVPKVDTYKISAGNSSLIVSSECRLGTFDCFVYEIRHDSETNEQIGFEERKLTVTIIDDGRLSGAFSTYNEDESLGLVFDTELIDEVSFVIINGGNTSAIHKSSANSGKCNILNLGGLGNTNQFATIQVKSVVYKYKCEKNINNKIQEVTDKTECLYGEYGFKPAPVKLNHMFAEGSTDYNIIINCRRHFNNFRLFGQKSWSGRVFNLNCNINLNGEEWTPIAEFRGTLYGNKHTISNLRIDIAQSDSVAEYHGFIGKNYGTIKNLKFTGINIIANTHHTDKAINVGGVVGYNYGTVREVIAQGRLNCNRYMSSMGGIIGTNAGTVYMCTAQDYYIYGNGDMGGIAGRMTSGSVKYCQTKKLNMNVYTVNGNRSAGGIVGYMPGGLVEYCCNRDNGVIFFDDFYNVGALSPKMGLIVGHAGSGATVRNVSVQGAKLSYDNLPETRWFTNCRQHVGAYGNGAVGFCEGATIGSTSWTPTGLYD